MGIGEIFYNQFYETKDKLTGRKVIRLTSDDAINHHPYFYNKMVTNDNRYLIYASDRSGKRDLYRLNLHTGETMQLTDEEFIGDFSPCLTEDDCYLIYSKEGNKIMRLCLETLDKEIIYSGGEDWTDISFGMSTGNKNGECYLLISELFTLDKVSVGKGWQSFQKQWLVKPRCRLVYLDTKSLKYHIVREEKNCWLGHPQIRPFHSDELLFCHEGPGEKIDARLWLVNKDGSNYRCGKEKEIDEMVTTHEYWLQDGSKIGFMHRKLDGNTTVRFLNPDNMVEEVMMECSHYCHFISNSDHTLIVGDGQPPKEGFLYLIDVKEKKESILCEHLSSFATYDNTQDAHPHPAFTPDKRSVIFTSDREGKPNIYKVNL